MSNLNHSVGGLVGFDIAIIAISAAAVALRFWSRGVSPNVQYSWDDWLALAALVGPLAELAAYDRSLITSTASDAGNLLVDS